MAITANMEDYLEAIFEIENENSSPEVRVTNIAKKLNVTKPSVVGMIKHLEEHKLVRHNRYGAVLLTSEGRKIARETLRKHRVLRRFLEEVLGLDAEIAEEDACKMEHTLSHQTIDRFMALEEFRHRGPSKGNLRGESFRKFLRGRNQIKEEIKGA